MNPGTRHGQSLTHKLKSKIILDFTTERDKYLSKSEPNARKVDGIAQVAATGSEFVSEIAHHRKDREAGESTEQNAIKPNEAREQPQSPGLCRLSPPTDDGTQVQGTGSVNFKESYSFASSFLSCT